MALPPELLQLLIQGQSTPTTITPLSGFTGGTPSLSGLPLGQEGVTGFGEGGSLLARGGGVLGGLDPSLLATLGLGAPEPIPAPPSFTAPIGGGSLGQFNFGGGFGAGGMLAPPGPAPSGKETDTAGLLKLIFSLGSKGADLFTQLFPQGGVGPIPSDVATGSNLATGGAGGFGSQLSGGSVGPHPNIPPDVASGLDIALGGTGATGALPAVSGSELLGAGGVFGETFGGTTGAGAGGAAGGLGGLGSGLALLPSLISVLGKLAGAPPSLGQSLVPIASILPLLLGGNPFLGPLGAILSLIGGGKANDLTAAQTEAMLRQVGAMARSRGPAGQLTLQKGLDAKLVNLLLGVGDQAFSLNDPTGIATPPSAGPLTPAFKQQLLTLQQNPKGTLTPAEIDTFGQTASPANMLKLLIAINEQRRLRTYAGLPTLAAPPPSVENALIPGVPGSSVESNPMLLAAYQAAQVPYDPLAGVSA